MPAIHGKEVTISNTDGKMAQNEWIYDSYYKAWYYLKSDGSYAHNAWQGAYYLKVQMVKMASE